VANGPTVIQYTKLNSKIKTGLMDRLTRRLNIQKYIEDFQVGFLDKFGVVPEVYLTPMQLDGEGIDLTYLKGMINAVVDTKKFPAGLYTRSRKREIVLPRQIYFLKARQMGYPLNQIAESLGFDHATVIHSCKCIKLLLEQKDPETLLILTKIDHVIKERLRVNADVQSNNKKGANT
jgi:hypothetical protein